MTQRLAAFVCCPSLTGIGRVPRVRDLVNVARELIVLVSKQPSSSMIDWQKRAANHK